MKTYLSKIILCIGFILGISLITFSQNCSIQGTISEQADTTKPIITAIIVLLKDINQIACTMPDIEGKYAIKVLDTGSYTIKVTCSNFKTIIHHFCMEEKEKKVLNFEMERDHIIIRNNPNILCPYPINPIFFETKLVPIIYRDTKAIILGTYIPVYEFYSSEVDEI